MVWEHCRFRQHVGPSRRTDRLKRKFPSVSPPRRPTATQLLCGGECEDEETLFVVVTAFELCFSCSLFRVALADDGNDNDDTRLLLAVNSHPRYFIC